MVVGGRGVDHALHMVVCGSECWIELRSCGGCRGVTLLTILACFQLVPVLTCSCNVVITGNLDRWHPV